MMKMFKRMMAVLLAVCLCLNSSAIISAASKVVTVATQAQLNKALKSGKATTIKISTKKSVKFTIPAGKNAKKVKLVVNAPKAKITNKAQFKSISLEGTAVSYVENGKNNVITIKAKKASFKVSNKSRVKKVVLKGGKANLTVNGGSRIVDLVSAKEDSLLNLRANGTVKLTVVSDGTVVNVRGTADKTKVEVEAKEVKVTAETAVDLTLKEEAQVVLKEGAEDSSVIAEKNVEIINDTKSEIRVTTPEGDISVGAGENVDTEKIPQPSPEPQPTTPPDSGNTGGGSIGGGSTGGGSVTPTPQPSKEANIVSFKINGIAGTISGTSISVTLPAGTDVTKLVPEITVSNKAAVSPASEVEQDFTAPVKYIVTAEDGKTTKDYMVTVTVENTPVVPEPNYMNVSVKKLENTNVPADGNKVNCKANQDAITVALAPVTAEGKLEVTVSGSLVDMKEFTSKNTEQASVASKWIGLIVETGETSIVGVKVDGIALTEADVTEADSVKAPKGSFILWLRAEQVVTTPRTLTLSADGKKPVEVTIRFEDTSSKGIYVENGTGRIYYENFETALQKAESGETVNVLSDVNTQDTCKNYDIDKAVTIKGANKAVVYGTLTLLTDGVTLDSLIIANRGGGMDKQKNAVNVVANTAVIKNCHIKMTKDLVDGVANGLCIYPLLASVNYTITGNTFEGYSLTAQGPDIKWTSTAVMITEGYNLKDRFSKDQITATDVVIAEGNNETAIAESNTYINCAIEWLHNDYSNSGNEYVYDYCVDGMATTKFSETKKQNARMVLVATEGKTSTIDSAKVYETNVTIELRKGNFKFDTTGNAQEAQGTKQMEIKGSFILAEGTTLTIADGHTIKVADGSQIKGTVEGAGKLMVNDTEFYPGTTAMN